MSKKKLSVFDIRATDEAKEAAGVWVDYGPFAFKIRRMGPGNVEFAKLTEMKLRPYQSAIRAGTMDDALARKILVEVFCKSVLVGWRRTVDGKDIEGVIPDDQGNDIQFSVENAVDVFTRAKGALDDLIERASALETFKVDEVTETTKN